MHCQPILAEHIYIQRTANFAGLNIPYQHHGIKFTLEDGTELVIHYSGNPNDFNGSVSHTNLVDFAYPSLIQEIKTIEHEKTLKLEEIIEKSNSRLGEKSYNLVKNNCEHFAYYCMTGEAKSTQVQLMKTFITLFAPQLLPFLQSIENGGVQQTM
eukprot:TRINITY_DN3221_c0_g1_i2.p1 TRINITY_DN3221_c0_g1~~TRINITY_DN3221_c0_g1_i2.p1  ORF type:complete len:155 (-),score=66.28 TRINITY_DN3221_c0_g1_i2:90-554(-)